MASKHTQMFYLTILPMNSSRMFKRSLLAPSLLSQLLMTVSILCLRWTRRTEGVQNYFGGHPLPTLGLAYMSSYEPPLLLGVGLLPSTLSLSIV